jgi:hypothetical protein
MLKLPEVNTICLSCGAHWYGTEGGVKRYTRQEWDAYANGELAVQRKRIRKRQNPYDLSGDNKGAKGLKL